MTIYSQLLWWERKAIIWIPCAHCLCWLLLHGGRFCKIQTWRWQWKLEGSKNPSFSHHFHPVPTAHKLGYGNALSQLHYTALVPVTDTHTPKQTCSWATLMNCLMQNWHILRSNYDDKALNNMEQTLSLCSSVPNCSHWFLLLEQQVVSCRSHLMFSAWELTNSKTFNPGFDSACQKLRCWFPDHSPRHSGYLGSSSLWASQFIAWKVSVLPGISGFSNGIR